MFRATLPPSRRRPEAGAGHRGGARGPKGTRRCVATSCNTFSASKLHVVALCGRHYDYYYICVCLYPDSAANVTLLDCSDKKTGGKGSSSVLHSARKAHPSYSQIFFFRCYKIVGSPATKNQRTNTLLFIAPGVLPQLSINLLLLREGSAWRDAMGASDKGRCATTNDGLKQRAHYRDWTLHHARTHTRVRTCTHSLFSASSKGHAAPLHRRDACCFRAIIAASYGVEFPSRSCRSVVQAVEGGTLHKLHLMQLTQRRQRRQRECAADMPTAN